MYYALKAFISTIQLYQLCFWFVNMAILLNINLRLGLDERFQRSDRFLSEILLIAGRFLQHFQALSTVLQVFLNTRSTHILFVAIENVYHRNSLNKICYDDILMTIYAS